MIVMDLEWNRGYDAKPVDEILQIGAVRVDGSGAIRDTFSVFIKPAIKPWTASCVLKFLVLP